MLDICFKTSRVGLVFLGGLLHQCACDDGEHTPQPLRDDAGPLGRAPSGAHSAGLGARLVGPSIDQVSSRRLYRVARIGVCI